MSTRPTQLGFAALRIIPLSPEQVADLLARAHEAQRAVRLVRALGASTAAARVVIARKSRLRAEAAARAVIAGRRVGGAAREYHCSAGSLQSALLRIAPWWRNRPSLSRCAARLVWLTGCSLSEAGADFGISSEAVRQEYARIGKVAPCG